MDKKIYEQKRGEVMLVTIDRCPKCEAVHIDLQVYRFAETIYYGQYYVKCPKTNKFFSIQKEVK